jgi:hypothetical protein
MVKRILTLQIMKTDDLFGRLLLEVQRIKSEGGYNAGKVSIENYIRRY